MQAPHCERRKVFFIGYMINRLMQVGDSVFCLFLSAAFQLLFSCFHICFRICLM